MSSVISVALRCGRHKRARSEAEQTTLQKARRPEDIARKAFCRNPEISQENPKDVISVKNADEVEVVWW